MTLARIVRISMVLVLLLPLFLVLLIVDNSCAHAYPREIKPGCRYDGRRYQEGMAVSTSEPCLRCQCTEGALRCRLRICPKLPNPPPPGCHVRSPEENVCCAELICGEPRDVENMLRRASVQTNAKTENEKHVHHSRTTEGCVYDGVRYGSGSAMMDSRRCEYCYCISGVRRCIRPKCLLPLPGCIPLYAPHSCCPVAYNCTHHLTSTMAPISGNGCQVGERTYIEGEMVRDIEWKAVCDNCFCAMGAIRCVPLACAPPLQGCSPIVREGQCCPSTYNCSGSIEVKATQNYASYAFISKDYAKFRKETNFFPATDQTTLNPPVEGRGHRVVIEERISTAAINLEEDSSVITYSTVWPSTTMETDIMDNEIIIGTVDYKSTLEVTTAATLTNELSSNTESMAAFETTSPATITNAADIVSDFCITCTTNIFTDSTIVTTEDSFSTNSTTVPSSEWTTATTLPELTLDNGNDENERTDGKENKNANVNEDRDANVVIEMGMKMAEKVDIIERDKATTYPAVIPTDVGDVFIPIEQSPEITTIAKRTETVGERPVTSPSSTILMPEDILVMNVTVKTNVSVSHIQGVTINPIRSISPDIEAILNISHREKDEDYDYDYSQPTLPPSLPNVRIIPFVAADALVKGEDESPSETGYLPASVMVSPELRPTDASGFYDVATQENRFSPPVETEGGFVPREPSYFDVPYRSTDLNLEIGTGVTVIPASITNPDRKNDDLSNNCRFEGMRYRHRETLPSNGFCIICVCYYGEVVCTREKCPPLKIGCRRVNSDERCCGKIICVDADESPTVVLDRVDATAPVQRQATVSPDPFRDVIKTEPAPDLPSLIEDMIPYLLEHGVSTSRLTTPMSFRSTTASSSKASTQAATQASTDGNQLQHSQSFDFMEQVPLIPPPFNYREKKPIDSSSFIAKIKYGINREAPTKNIISSTYNSKTQNLSREPVNLEDTVFSYNKTILTISNHTTESPENDLSRSNTTELVKVVFNIDDFDKNITGKIDDHTAKYNDRSKSNDSSIENNEKKINEQTEDDDSIFSLDSVLDLLFASNISNSVNLFETTKLPDVFSIDSVTANDETTTISPLVTSSTNTVELTERTEGTTVMSTKVDINNEIPMSLLKLAGCNIYGRMYRVGRIITELSNPCSECKCTEIGVQCKQLQC